MAVFENEIAVVTGASRGIGRAVAAELAQHGASVVVNYRSHMEEADALVSQIEAGGGNAIACRADVSVESEVRELFRAAVSRFQKVDILVCNAGIVRDQLIGAMSLEEWDTVIQTNLRSVFLCVREALPFMMMQRRGSVVAMSSIAAQHGTRGHANYAASKGGINSMVRALAVELGRKGIRVNAVAPGLIQTEMTSRVRTFAGDQILEQVPLRRFGAPEDVARAVRFLASKEADYITGEVLYVTGGLGL